MSVLTAIPKPTPGASRLSSVAIIGTEGTGKTVLITALAARFGNVTADGMFLDPNDSQGATYKYVSRSWEILSKGQWPPLTKRGELFQLQWTLQQHNAPVADLRMLDVSGEDLRVLFDDGQIDDVTKLPDALRRIAEYLRDATIVLVLVDLDDIVCNRNGEHARQTEWVINYALKCAKDDGHQGATALVFTKTDRYEALLQQEGGLEGAARKYLPLVYGKHMADGQLSVLSVAAVADTCLDASSGTPHSVPAPNFRSRGLDTLMSWVREKAGQLYERELDRHRLEVARCQAEARAAHAAKLKRTILTCAISFMAAMATALAIQVVTIPVLRYVLREEVHTPQITQGIEARQESYVVHHPSDIWHLWLNGWDETKTRTFNVPVEQKQDVVSYKVSAISVGVWDFLLSVITLVGAFLIAFAWLRKMFRPNSPPRGT